MSNPCCVGSGKSVGSSAIAVVRCAPGVVGMADLCDARLPYCRVITVPRTVAESVTIINASENSLCEYEVQMANAKSVTNVTPNIALLGDTMMRR